MKISLDELKKIVAEAIKNVEELKEKVRPDGYKADDNMDFSMPSQNNRYKRQGASNMGTWTSESKLKTVISNVIKEVSKPIAVKHATTCAPFSEVLANDVTANGWVGKRSNKTKKLPRDITDWEVASMITAPKQKKKKGHDIVIALNHEGKEFWSIAKENLNKK